MFSINELKNKIIPYSHLVTGISKLRRDELNELYTNLQLYDNNRINYNYYKYKFKETIITINEEQYNIITSDKNNNLRIISAAGCAKTTTIICRIKYLIDNGIKPERIIATTFNVEAAESMKQKIKDLFGF